MPYVKLNPGFRSRLRDCPVQYAIARAVGPVVLRAIPDAMVILGVYMVEHGKYVPRLALAWGDNEHTAGWVYFWEDRITARPFISKVEGFPEPGVDEAIFYADPKMEESVCAAVKKIWREWKLHMGASIL